MLLSACDSGNPSQNVLKAPDSQQIFHYPTESEADFGTLDPALAKNAGDVYAIQLIFTGLVQLDNKGNVKDQLAQSHDISKDGLTYTFHLRPKLKFSDGTPLTANDVAYSINRVLLPATHSPVATYLKLIKGYTDITTNKVATLIGTSLIVQNNQTLSIIISKPAAYFLSMLTYPSSYVVEKSLIDQYGPNWTNHLSAGGGDGPFKVTKYIPGKTFNVVPNPDYYGPQPALKESDLSFSGDTNATYTAYKNHQYDWATVPLSKLPEAEKGPDFYQGNLLNTYTIAFNFLAQPFNNLHIRQAFDLAINKQHIADITGGGSIIPTNTIVPKGMSGFNPDLQAPDGTASLTGNQSQATQLFAQGMQEEGYNNIGNLPSLVLTMSTGNPTNEKIIHAIADEWSTVLHVHVRVNAIDPNVLGQQINATNGNNSLQMWATDWQTDYPDPQNWLTTPFGSGQNTNFVNYGDKRNERTKQEQDVQNELNNADSEPDPAKRLKLYNDAEQKLVNDAAWVPIYQSALLVVQNPKLHGYKINALQITDPDSWKDVYFTV